MPAKMEITGEIARILLSGDFDFSTQGSLGEVTAQALNSVSVREIQIDMGSVTFMDSSFIRALLQLQEAAKAHNKTLSLWNCNEQIRNTFGIGGFDQLFTIH
jgi:HptB-dependent secretion and biofilm anti anti-sigma factor